MKNRQQGFTLTEILIVMVVIGAFFTVIAPIASNTQESSRYTNATQDISHLRVIASNYKMANDNFDAMDMDALKALGARSDENPWGGDYTVTPATDKRTYTLAVSEVDDRSIDKLVAMMSEGARGDATKSDSTVSATYRD